MVSLIFVGNDCRPTGWYAPCPPPQPQTQWQRWKGHEGPQRLDAAGQSDAAAGASCRVFPDGCASAEETNLSTLSKHSPQ